MTSFENILSAFMKFIILFLLIAILVLFLGKWNDRYINRLLRSEYPDKTPLTQKNVFYRHFKRFIDIWFGAILLVLYSPIMLECFLLIKLEDFGPAMYFRRCIGYKGKVIRYRCFRTLRMTAEEIPLHKENAPDPRLLKSGRAIRMMGLDYLPMILSVIKGDMTLVGLARILPEYAEYKCSYKELFDYEKPGMIGLSTNQSGLEEKERADRIYLLNRGILLDFRLMAYAALNISITLWRSTDRETNL